MSFTSTLIKPEYYSFENLTIYWITENELHLLVSVFPWLVKVEQTCVKWKVLLEKEGCVYKTHTHRWAESCFSTFNLTYFRWSKTMNLSIGFVVQFDSTEVWLVGKSFSYVFFEKKHVFTYFLTSQYRSLPRKHITGTLS